MPSWVCSASRNSLEASPAPESAPSRSSQSLRALAAAAHRVVEEGPVCAGANPNHSHQTDGCVPHAHRGCLFPPTPGWSAPGTDALAIGRPVVPLVALHPALLIELPKVGYDPLPWSSRRSIGLHQRPILGSSAVYMAPSYRSPPILQAGRSSLHATSAPLKLLSPHPPLQTKAIPPPTSRKLISTVS